MVFPRFGNPRRILRVLPQASRFLANLWLPAPRRGPQENLLQKCAETRPRHGPKGLPGLGFRLYPPRPCDYFRLARHPPTIQELVWPSRRANACEHEDGTEAWGTLVLRFISRLELPVTLT